MEERLNIVKGNFASGHLVANSGVNFYILTSPNGQDLNKAGLGEAPDDSDTVIGVGNCYISDYTVDMSVGSLPTVSVTVEGANMNSVAESCYYWFSSSGPRGWNFNW